ncbi:MAG TPA: diacylglycerol kinase family protein [Croceibacterium sp.]|nr:diacylglycerol kinase family protein [Croceibacterium sp.]
MKPVVQLFSNPAAGPRKARRIAALARALEAEGATVIHSESAGSPPVIGDGVTHVCVAAGDGTVRHVAGAVARGGHDVTLSIFPAGTVNLLAMEAGYPRRPRAFARYVLASRPPRHHYPVAIGEGWFFACAGVGPDSLAVAGVSTSLKRRIGRLAYLVAVARLLHRWPRHRIRLAVDGHELACEAFYVAKGRYYAGRWRLAREARVDDPALHVVALARARRRDYARFVLSLALGRDLARLANVRIIAGTALHASADAALPVQADGDIVCALPVTLAVRELPLVFC